MGNDNREKISQATKRGMDRLFSTNDAYEAYNTSEVQQAQTTYEALEDDEEKYSTKATQGKKGKKMPRMTMAFAAANYDYIKTMAGINGISVTEYLNRLIERDRDANSDKYELAKKLRDEVN